MMDKLTFQQAISPMCKHEGIREQGYKDGYDEGHAAGYAKAIEEVQTQAQHVAGVSKCRAGTCKCFDPIMA